jgi:hypothetical protein
MQGISGPVSQVELPTAKVFFVLFAHVLEMNAHMAGCVCQRD